MKNYPFSFQALEAFSRSNPYLTLNEESKQLYEYFKSLERELNFPAITDDIGNFLGFILSFIRPSSIFEFGSGYGQSAFWYLLNNSDSLKKIYLTEKRDDLICHFESAPWPTSWKEKIEYYQGDAFERFESIEEVDFLLIDGVKADYLKFLTMAYPKMSQNSLVCIDNSYWRGSFLDNELNKTKHTAIKIKELHDFISSTKQWEAVFIPYTDGLTLLKPIFS